MLGVLITDSVKNVVHMAGWERVVLMCIRGGRWVPGDPLEVVRKLLGMAFRKPEFGGKEVFFFLWDTHYYASPLQKG